jgi:hypothetical protein
VQHGEQQDRDGLLEVDEPPQCRVGEDFLRAAQVSGQGDGRGVVFEYRPGVAGDDRSLSR